MRLHPNNNTARPFPPILCCLVAFSLFFTIIIGSAESTLIFGPRLVGIEPQPLNLTTNEEANDFAVSAGSVLMDEDENDVPMPIINTRKPKKVQKGNLLGANKKNVQSYDGDNAGIKHSCGPNATFMHSIPCMPGVCPGEVCPHYHMVSCVCLDGYVWTSEFGHCVLSEDCPKQPHKQPNGRPKTTNNRADRLGPKPRPVGSASEEHQDLIPQHHDPQSQETNNRRPQRNPTGPKKGAEPTATAEKEKKSVSSEEEGKGGTGRRKGLKPVQLPQDQAANLALETSECVCTQGPGPCGCPTEKDKKLPKPKNGDGGKTNAHSDEQLENELHPDQMVVPKEMKK